MDFIWHAAVDSAEVTESWQAANFKIQMQHHQLGIESLL